MPLVEYSPLKIILSPFYVNHIININYCMKITFKQNQTKYLRIQCSNKDITTKILLLSYHYLIDYYYNLTYICYTFKVDKHEKSLDIMLS